MSSAQNLAEELLKIYNDIDAFLRRQPDSGDRHADHSSLIRQVARHNRVVARYESEMRAAAQLRNIIVHNPLSETASPLAMPHIELVNRYGEIRMALLHPASALSIAVPASQIYTATLETPLRQVLKDMNDNIFTHVPIIKNNQMIGIFSENALLSYLADNSDVIILGDMTMEAFKQYLPLKAHKGEHFEFLPRRASLADVYTVFNRAIKVRRRIGMLFITEHGKHYEKPLGIVTAWDLASPEFELR